MTILTDPVHVEVPGRTPVQPSEPLDPPRDAEVPAKSRRRSQGFTVRSSNGDVMFGTWERAVGTARSLAVLTGGTTSVTDDDTGTRLDVATDGRLRPSAS